MINIAVKQQKYHINLRDNMQYWGMLLLIIMVLGGCGTQSLSEETTITDPLPTSTQSIQPSTPTMLKTLQPDAIPLTVELTIHDGSPKTIMVQQDGRVSLTEQDQTQEIHVQSEDITLLHQVIEGERFFDLEDNYPGSRCCDAIAHTITVTTPIRNHTVYCYNQCPEAFERIIQAILVVWPRDIEYKGLA